MAQDLASRDLALSADEVEAIESLSDDRGRNFVVDFPFGALNLYQVAEWVGKHAMRHRAQLTRLS